jgi:hypothetical protein
MKIKDCSVVTDLTKNLKENIRCQTGLCVIDNKVIAYKQVKKNLRSFYKNAFIYPKKGHVMTNVSESEKDRNISCGQGLHFSNANYWNNNELVEESTFLIAEIQLEDILSVQDGKIRCSKANILGTYNIEL